MKKALQSLILLLAILPFKANSQVENGDFESWTSFNYTNPNGWDCANKEVAEQISAVTVTQVAGYSGNAVRMETMVIGSDVHGAYIANGDPMDSEGGIPCSQIPTAISGFYRYNLPVNDSALILVTFKSNGVPINSDIFMIKGTGSQNTFISFSYPLTLSQTPDTVIMAFASSNLINNVGIENGSFLEVDDITLTGSNTTIPNNSFETWDQATIDNITGWVTNGNVVKTNDSHNGSFAIQLTTQDFGNGNVSPSYMTNGQNSQMGFVGGIPYNRMNDTLIGYYKYSSSGGDSASIGVSFYANGSNIGGSGRYMPAAPIFTYFEIPMNVGVTPDTMRIDISSSKWPTGPSNNGSTLIIDDLQFKSELTLEINKVDGALSGVGVYPNPAGDYLNFKFEKPVHGTVALNIYDVSGRMVKTEIYGNNEKAIHLDISSLTKGMYFYTISGNAELMKGKFAKN